MIGEIIAIGDELTSGRILNSTSSFAAGHLFAAGHEVIAMSTVGDTPDMIGEALQKALNRADFIIVTGGLGATSDDLTNEAVSMALERPSTFRPEIIEKMRSAGHIHSKCPHGGCGGKRSLEKLAWLPEGAQVLKPEARMAGYLLVHDNKPIFFLPGVPHEMRELMLDIVLPWLSDRDGQNARQVVQKIYRVFGQREIEINRKLAGLEQQYPGIRVGYYPVFPEVHISITVTALDRKEADSLFRQCDADIQATLAPFVYGAGEETMEAVVGNLLTDHNKCLATAESCTGGLVAHRITRVPGSSGYFFGGIVAYSNSIKESLLGVGRDVLNKYGAVSAQTAGAMAKGGRHATGADICISVTGIAGPDGGTSEKPVGTVYMGLADSEETRDFLFKFSGKRRQIQSIAAQTALDLVRRKLLGIQKN